VAAKSSLVRWLVAAALWAVPLPASAHGGGGESGPPLRSSDLPPSPLKRRILDVERKRRAGHHSPASIRQPLSEAIRAAERAQGARVAGDPRQAALLTKLGERWVRTAEALLDTGISEARARVHEGRAVELLAKLERARVLLAEQQARLVRLRAELAQAEKGRNGRAPDEVRPKGKKEKPKDKPKPKGPLEGTP
jgi:hypothetical protein